MNTYGKVSEESEDALLEGELDDPTPEDLAGVTKAVWELHEV